MRHRKPARVVWAVVIAVQLSACGDLFGPPPPTDSIPLTAVPAQYEGWWSLVQTCAGLQGRLKDIRWRILPGQRTLPGSNAVGRYYSRDHQIVLVEEKQLDGYTVRHEMLHALTRLERHPPLYFVERCGGLVSCGGTCLRDVGGPPSAIPGAEFIGASAFALTVQVVPEAVYLTSGTRGCVTIVVSAQNTRTTAVAIGAHAGQGARFSWSVEGIGAGYGGGPVIPDTLYFAPGETHRYAFDCPSLLRMSLVPGVFSVRGKFFGAATEPRPFAALP